MIPQLVIEPEKEQWQSIVSELIQREHVPLTHVIQYGVESPIKIDEVRECTQLLSVGSLEPRCVILYAFENATLEAQNALLKTLEEKAIHTIFILFAQSIETIAPTIISRCMTSLSHEYVRESTDDSLVLATRATMFTDKKYEIRSREGAINFFDAHVLWYKKNLIQHTGYAAQLRKAITYRYLVIHNNLQPQLAVDCFILSGIE